VAVDPSADVVIDASSPGVASSPGGLEESSPDWTPLDPPLLVGVPLPEELPEPPELCEAPLEPPFAGWPDWKEVPELELEQAQAVTRATTETIRRTFIGAQDSHAAARGASAHPARKTIPGASAALCLILGGHFDPRRSCAAGELRLPRMARRVLAVRGGTPEPGVPVLLMSSNAAAEPLTDDEATALQQALSKYEPKDVHDALDRIDEQTLRGCQASLNASGALVGGATEPGVFVHKLEGGRAAIRVAYADINGAIYDDLELAASAVKRLVETLIVLLDAKRAPHRP
jgi:hypothetical protein